jgi:WD40 repeat protein
MARIFISHSSADNDQAAQMKVWLASAGFDSAFLDKDKTTGIPPGADWERTLYREVEQSQAVIIIQTPNWLDSKWCFAEFTQARALGKAIFPAIVAPTGNTLISPDIQALNLLSDRDGGLDRLKRELVRIALDAQGGFDWDARRPPFPGMLAFDEEDAAVYFGRDDDIRRLIERLEARRAQGGAKLIALLGSSGSGKSSLLRAGAIPRLKRAGRNWIVVPPMRPRLHPIDELATALATARDPPVDWAKVRDDLIGSDPSRALEGFSRNLLGEARANEARILIPIDQAEELFGVADRDEARRFLAILSQALSESLPFMAVMTIRSDFLGQLQSAASLTARFEEFSLGPLPLARIPQIIEGPAHRTGLRVEDEFVQQAAHDAETQDALPLLAFTLRQLFDRSKDGSLTLQAYEALGDKAAGLTPLENAVRKAADAVLDEANATNEEKTALREAFVPAMVRVNEQGEYVRRPARMDALPPMSHPLLERLAKARLLVIRQEGDARVVEVAHEALLRKWPWLKEKLDAERVFLIGKQQLEQDLRDWQAAADKDKADALLTGLKLTRARAWLVEHPTRLTADERVFIQASVERAEQEERRNARTRRYITWGSIAAAVVLAIVAGVAGFLFIQAQKSAAAALESEQQAKASQKTASANESRALTALSQTANSNGRYTDGVKLALAAWPRSPSDTRPQLPQTIEMLGQALTQPLEVAPPLQHNGYGVFSATFDRDGGRLLTMSEDKVARIWDATAGKVTHELSSPSWGIDSATFSLDGKLIVTTAPDIDQPTQVLGGAAQVWNAATGDPIGKPMRHAKKVNFAAFSPDGALVVTASDDATAQVWDAATGLAIGKPMRQSDAIRNAAFSPDGKWIVTGSLDHTAQVWDAATHEPVGSRMKHEGGVIGAAFSFDNQRVVTWSFDKTAQVWDATTAMRIGNSMQHEDWVRSAAFSLDGKRVVTASQDRARVWDAATGAPLREPLKHDDDVSSVAFSPDGLRILTASKNLAQVWDAATGTPIGNPMRHSGAVNSAVFSRDGERAATASTDGTARVWELTAGKPIGSLLQHQAPIAGDVFSLDGARLATMSGNTTDIWDAETGAQIGKAIERDAEVVGVALNSDGSRLVTASKDKTQGYTVRVWEVAAGAVTKATEYKDPVLAVAFGANGPRAVTASGNAGQLWDAATGAPIGNPLLHEQQVLSATFSPDGAKLLTECGDAVQVWDASSAAPIGKPLKHGAKLHKATFSTDGSLILTTSGVASRRGSGWISTARLWLAATGEPVGEPLQRDGKVVSVAFGPDGARLLTTASSGTQVWNAAAGSPIGKSFQGDDGATFNRDGTQVLTAAGTDAQVWDAATGEPIGPRLQHANKVTSAAFTPDGRRLLTLSGNVARLWSAPPVAPNLIATACKMLGANRDTAGLAQRYGVEIKDPICTGNEPAPDPSLMTEH